MPEKPRHNKPDPAFVKEKILLNRKYFIAYNIAFHSIPFLLHTNSPDLPGYLDDPLTPHGIYRFFHSGFWEFAKKRLRIKREDVHTFVLKRSYIRGLYLMGSSGTLGQTEYSDFDYWVVIDKDSLSETQLALLRQKLDRIEDWSKETYGHELNFFVVDLEQIRQNDFSEIHEEGSRTAQKSLLKEEFYLTFIMIAGQIPFWAVLPPGLNDAEHRCWIETASLLSDDNFVCDDYVDLGNLTSIKREECLGGVLWQICKAQQDPVKSLIKTSLVAHHFFFQEQEGLLSDMMKKRFPERRLDSYLLDPYALVFEKATRLYDLMDDKDGLDLIRQCIYLRLTGYPVPSELAENSPKRQILKRYVKAWSWSSDQIDRLQSYPVWTENEKLQFEDRIINKISFLYKLILRAAGKPEPFMDMASEDLAVLKNRIASHFKKKPGKLPLCSAYLRAKQDRCSLSIGCRDDSSGAKIWAVYDHTPSDCADNKAALFVAPELLRVLGWIVLNRLYKGDPSSIVFQRVPKSPISPKRAERLLKALARFFFSNEMPRLNYMRSDPPWLKVFVSLGTDIFAPDNVLRSVDYLVQNTWGEMFFCALDLEHIENDFLRCYETAKRAWHYLQKALPGESEYRIYDSRAIEDTTTTKTIEDFIKSFRESGAEHLKAREAQGPEKTATGRNGRGRPLLDLL
ncbi:MAG: class I adenylate cyclase [Deltaproteobacteria bacterium]|nr:class I adenylate cyclase [Deltaproteobacteria bacterium]